MKFATFLLLGCTNFALAQLPPHPAPQVTRSGDTCNLDWTGQNGVTYFVQYSLDLQSWSYMPVIESGDGSAIGYGFQCDTDKMFLRLHYTDTPTSNPSSDDFDGDGISNWDEVRVGGTGTSPLKADTDGDGIRDDGLVYAAQNDPDGANFAANLQTGLVGRWDFESVGGFPASFPSTPTTIGAAVAVSGALWGQNSGMPSHCTQLGNSGYLTLPASILNGATHASYSIWVKFSEGALSGTTGFTKTILSVGPDTTLPPLLHWFVGLNKKIYVDTYWLSGSNYTKANLGQWNAPDNLDDGKWHHVALASGGGKYHVYVDGQSIGEIQSNSIIYNLAQPTGATPYFLVGKAEPTPFGSDYLQADVDRLRVYDRKLSGAEVQDLRQTDVDNDELYDWFENEYRKDRVIYFDALELDDDRDGLTNHEEQQEGTDPRNFDSDGDLLPDGFEQMYQLDPLSSESPNGTNDDPDGDGLTNLEEAIYGTDPNNPNTDGDNNNDKVEVDQGSLPNDASDGGMAPLPEEIMVLRLSVGDPSTSHSERYLLQAIDLETGTTIIEHQATDFGVVTPGTYNQFRKGKSYAFKIRHIGTNKTYPENPDYDYFSEVVFVNPDDVDGYGIFDPFDPNLKEIATPANGQKVIEDKRKADGTPEGTGSNGSSDFTETIERYEALYLIPQVAVDNNRDGEITFDGKDMTTEAKPYVFWVNNDSDKGHTVDLNDWEEDDLENGNDATEDGLHSRRDLEDLSRIWIDLSSLQKVYGKDLVGLNLSVTMTGDQEINIFQAVEEDGGRQYLQDENVGWNQYQANYGEELVSSVRKTAWLPVDFRGSLKEDGRCYFLFEGQKAGQGKLWFRVAKNGEAVAYSLPIHLDLKDVTEMYETWSVGNVAESGVQWENTWPASSATQVSGQNLPAPETIEEKDYVLFVHGWNMPEWEKTAFASTMFKRMWHQGYKGRFGLFQWPTFHSFSLLQWDSTAHFDGSEQRAWNSAAPLAALVDNLAATFKDNNGNSLVRCYAHSMGNIVVSEALRQMTPDSKVHTYISAQAALSAHVWDSTTPDMDYTPSTPDVYAHYWQSGATSTPADWATEQRPSYMAPQYMPPLVKFINHYNADDWALTGLKWENNQKLKPDAGYHYGETLFNPTDHFYERKVAPTTRDLDFPDDRFEIFSYAAESRAFATGAEGVTGGKFNVADSVDLDAEFDFGEAHKGHSAQFRSFIQKRWSYWEQALDDMAIVTP